MADAIAPATTAAAPAAPAQAEVTRLPNGSVDPVAAGQAAQAALAEERAKLDAPAAVETEKVEPAKDGKPERGADGKFKGKADAKPAEQPAKPEPAKEPEQPSGSIHKARRLMAEGKAVEAIEFALGKPIDEIDIPSKAFAALRREVQGVRSQRAEVDQLTDALKTKYAPIVEAQKAVAAGDYEGAIKAAFGMSLIEFQKALVTKFHEQPADPPSVKALKDELAVLRAEREQERQQREQMSHAEREQAATQQFEAALSAIDEPDIAAVSAKPAFRRAVMEQLQTYWDDRTQTTIPIHEAARLAFDELYDGILPEQHATGARQTPRQPAPGPKPARTATKPAAATLNRSNAAEAAPRQLPPPGSRELLELAIKEAEEGMRREREQARSA